MEVEVFLKSETVLPKEIFKSNSFLGLLKKAEPKEHHILILQNAELSIVPEHILVKPCDGQEFVLVDNLYNFFFATQDEKTILSNWHFCPNCFENSCEVTKEISKTTAKVKCKGCKQEYFKDNQKESEEI